MSGPRPFWRLWLRGWGWVAVVAALVSLVFLPVWYFPSRNAEYLAADGIETLADVTDLRVNRSGDDTDHDVFYRFTSYEGRQVTDRKDVSVRFFNSLTKGDKIPVRYLRTDPGVSEIEFGTNAFTGRIGLMGLALSLLITAFACRKAWVKAGQIEWLRTQAVQRRVRVIDHIRTNVTINDIPQWKATWREDTGREGATRMSRRDRLPAIGSEITIFIDPHGQIDSVWSEDV